MPTNNKIMECFDIQNLLVLSFIGCQKERGPWSEAQIAFAEQLLINWKHIPEEVRDFMTTEARGYVRIDDHYTEAKDALTRQTRNFLKGILTLAEYGQAG